MGKQFQVDTGGTLTTNLLSYYKLDQDSTDFFGTVNGTDTNMAYDVGDGKVNSGAKFVGTSEINFGNNNDAGAGAWSVSAWIKTSGTSQFIAGKSSSGANAGWEFYLDSNGHLQINFFDAGGADVTLTYTVAALNNGVWHHVVGTRDAGGAGLVILYVDGTNVTSTNNGAHDTTNTHNFTMGVDDASHFPMTGSIDEVGLWNKALSSTEVTDLYNSGQGQTMIGSSPVVAQLTPAFTQASSSPGWYSSYV